MEQSLKKIIRVLLDSIVLLIILALIFGFNPLEIDKNILSIAHLVEYENIDSKIPILVLVIIVSITIFTASLIINRKVQVNTFRKSLEGLLPPILAEAVLDGKVSVRNLIMTSIVDLCVRGNIRIINNDILELVSLRDLEEYELSIVHLLFVKRVVRISDMNEIFAKSNVETLNFSYKLRKIRNLIVKRLFDLNIYSESLSKSNAIIRICAFILALNTPLLLQSDYNLCFALALINISIITIFIRGTQNQTSFREEWILSLPKGRRRGNLGLPFVLLFFIFVVSLQLAIYHPFFAVAIILTVAINICTVFLSNKLALSYYGRIEYAKLVELKNYMDSNVLNDTNSLSGSYLDKYSPYAVAFGKPIKIANEIDEKMYNLNIHIQAIQQSIYYDE